MICVDVANGYREVFLEFIKDVRRNFPDSIITAGNVATREMTEALILAGADVVKVGIGPGSVCTTRKVAGVGYPQLSAISECADASWPRRPCDGRWRLLIARRYCQGLRLELISSC